MLSFYPRGVLGEILNLIESVSEGFPSYYCKLLSSVLRLGHFLRNIRARAIKLGTCIQLVEEKAEPPIDIES